MLHSPASSIRVVLCLALGASLSVPPAHALASASAPAPNARERSQLLVAEGDAAFAKDAIEESISKYRASYYGLPPEDQASYLGSLPVRKAMRAYDSLVAAAAADPNKQRAILQRQRVLLEEFLDAVAAKPGAAEDLGEEVMTELEATHRSITTALEPKSTDDGGSSTDDPADDPNDPVTTTNTTATTEPPTDGTTTGTTQRDWLGLGLVIGGSVTLAAGLGVGVGRWTIRNNAQQLVDAGGEEFAPGTDARADYLETENARAQKFLIAGSVVAGVGLATTIAGVVHILVRRRRAATPAGASAMHLVPALSPTTAGLVLHRRF